jgi:hypothetical protein
MGIWSGWRSDGVAELRKYDIREAGLEDSLREGMHLG